MAKKPLVIDPEEAVSYRIPLTVREVMLFKNSDEIYPVCPRCDKTLDREYMRHCNICGQALNWRGFRKCTIVYPGPREKKKSE